MKKIKYQQYCHVKGKGWKWLDVSETLYFELLYNNYPYRLRII